MDSENYFEVEYFDDTYYEEEYLPQPVGCLPIFLAVMSVAMVMIFALSQIEINLPTTTESATSFGGTTGLGGGIIAPLFTPEIQYWSESISKWSEQTGIDPNLIATVMQIESCGDPRAKSSAGAMGLFQVMPYHFKSGEDPYKPDTNALRGLDYLRRALEAREGVVRLGFAGYNGGITGAQRPESQWANETQRYVYWGTGIYEDAIQGKEHSDRLDEWLGRGGASLCKQSAERLGSE
jgi:hypothetical protein